MGQLPESELEQKAMEFATQRHGDQKRKYTLDSYVVHLEEVANWVRTVPHTQEQLAVAWLHDTLEDTDTTYEELEVVFSHLIARHVWYLSDISSPSDGNRATRKAMDREHLRFAPPAAQTVKLADILSNTASIVEHDPKFARVYLPEKVLLLPLLDKGDRTLFSLASEAVQSGLVRLGIG